MRHPVSSLERLVVSDGSGVPVWVVEGGVVPGAPEDADPGAGEDADGVGMVAAAGAGAPVDVCGPWGGVSGVVGEAGDGGAEAMVAGPSEDDAAAFSGGMGDRADTGPGGEVIGGGEALTDVAELGEDVGGAEAPGTREGHADLAVGQFGDGALDAAGELGDLADRTIEDGGEGPNHLALGLGFGLGGKAGRGGPQAGEQLGGA